MILVAVYVYMHRNFCHFIRFTQISGRVERDVVYERPAEPTIPTTVNHQRSKKSNGLRQFRRSTIPNASGNLIKNGDACLRISVRRARASFCTKYLRNFLRGFARYSLIKQCGVKPINSGIRDKFNRPRIPNLRAGQNILSLFERGRTLHKIR